MQAQVPPSLYWPDTVDSVIARMRAGLMPSPFIRRMRLVNIISAVVLRKIEPELLAPFDVEDLHHVLDRQISQDAVIDQLDSEAVAAALTTGDMKPLEDVAGGNPLLAYGLESGWIQKFFNDPFNPLCVMLAMRTKLLLDAIDEMGHSYNLIRMIGLGWVDFGDIPGEDPGNPGDYYPPALDNPIVIPPAGGGPGPGEPGYVPPSPGAPGYAPPGPGPGEPGYVPPSPGAPGYAPPGPSPGAPGYAPPGPARMINMPGGGGGQLGGPLGSMSAPSGYLDQGMWTGTPGSAGGMAAAVNCCLSWPDPVDYVSIGGSIADMVCGTSRTFTIDDRNPVCETSHYIWCYTPETGTLVDNDDFTATYTAPDGGEECVSPVTISLECGGEQVDAIIIAIISCPSSATILPEKTTMLVDTTQTLTAVPGAPGCGTPEYTWEKIEGGGSLSASTGETVQFTAPATNSDCENTPIITLSCGSALLDTLELAVNAVESHAYYAWQECVFDHCVHGGIDPTWEYAVGKLTYTYCDGSKTEPQWANGMIESNPGGCDRSTAGLLAMFPSGDLRTPTQKADGCCPDIAL